MIKYDKVSKTIARVITSFMFNADSVLSTRKYHNPFLVLNKEGKASHRRNEMKGKDAINFVECARKDVFKEYLDARVTCENRSLVELRDKSSPIR